MNDSYEGSESENESLNNQDTQEQQENDIKLEKSKNGEDNKDDLDSQGEK